jgi:methylamine---glutamate N-methyltransferase subunit B
VGTGTGTGLFLDSAALSNEFDLARQNKRDLNATLHGIGSDTNRSHWRVLNPGGQHALAVGLTAPITIEIEGHAGYYCAGMNQRATVIVHGNAATGVAENMMSGFVHVHGDASQSAGASAHGGMLLIDGNAAARCAISLKGADIVVKGSVGHLSAFMAQAGTLTVFGDTGESLGDSIYEARLYVRGSVASLGADCVEKELRDEHRAELHAKLTAAGVAGEVDVASFRRYGSARRLYNFHVDNAADY